MRERTATYTSLGKLYQITTKLNDTEDNRVSFTYDSFGNVTRVNDLDNTNGSVYYKQNIIYDTTLKTYPVSFDNSFLESSSIQYEYLFGTPILSTDMNGEQMRTRIDNRGRVVEVTGPNEMAIENQGSSGSKWTIRMEYKDEEAITGNINSNIYMLTATGVFQAIEPGGSNPTHAQHYAVTRHFDPLISNNQFLTISIVDGFGQPVQVKKTHKSGVNMRWLISGCEKKDPYGRVLNSYLPTTQTGYPTNLYSISGTNTSYAVISPSSLPAPVIMIYDEKDRVKTVKQPGESQTSQITYSVDEGMLVQNVTNELSQTMATYTDIRGRNRKTVQNGEVTTTFIYNAVNELIKVMDNDSFETNYVYDLAGRTLEIQHPDRGVITFKYNKKGNVIEQSNSNMILNGNQKVNYYYDFHRLIRVEYPQMPLNEVKYTYGAGGDSFAMDNNAVGRLLTQEDASGVQVFSYGHMGEVTKNLRSVAVAGYQSFWLLTEWKYDSWNRVQEIIYPDFEKVTYHYNNAGMVEKIDSQISGITGLQKIVKNVSYNDYGERSSVEYGNGTVTNYDYDVRRRMNTLSHSFTNFGISKKYEFDALSNILSIKTEDPANTLPATGQIGGPVTHNYHYDDYNQLIDASGSYTGSNDVSTPYLQQDYQLTMKYNLDHTIDNKVQLHNQGLVSSYGGNVSNQIVVEKNSYDLKYSEYGTGPFVVDTQNGSYGYQQPHAPRKITEYPSWVSVSENDPRVRHKEIDYDANGNQTEIKEKVDEEYVSLRKNLWDEENRLVGVDLNPDEETGHPIAVYTYDAGGERVIKYNLDRIDVSSNATEVGQETKDNVMIYPSGLLMGKVTKVSASENRFIYTKHYYMGTERISAKTGTFRDLGLYPDKMVLDKFPGINPTIIRNLSNQSVNDAETIVSYVYGQFDQTANIPEFNSFEEDELTDRSTHDPKLYDAFYFHPDHLGSSSYISNLAGNVSQHIEYMPFGEMLVDEHINSFNTPFKFNGKEFDEETGNYYYGARYYDPKWSIFIGVDPLADKYPDWSSFAYCYNNPIRYVDPDGRAPEDIIYIDSKGNITKVEKNNSATITIVDGGKSYNLSDYSIGKNSLFANNNRNREVVANVALYYAKQIGVHSIGATPTQGGLAHYNPKDDNIYIAPASDGKVNSHLDNYFNLQSVIKHEFFHKEDHRDGIETTFVSHASVYLRQMQDETFENTTEDFAYGMILSFISYLESAKSKKMDDYKGLIDEFNKSNIRGGLRINDRGSGGMQLFDNNCKERSLPLMPDLIDAH